jgi:hypothetical protein
MKQLCLGRYNLLLTVNIKAVAFTVITYTKRKLDTYKLLYIGHVLQSHVVIAHHVK